MAAAFASLESPVFVGAPRASSRAGLIPCSVVEQLGDRCTLQLPPGAAAFAVGAVVVLHYEHWRRFYRQQARVTSVEGGHLVHLEAIGEAEDSNQRSAQRITCPDVPVTATIGEEADCQVVDVSNTGFAVRCRTWLRVGSTVAAVLHFDGRSVAGEVTVMSVRDLATGPQTRDDLRRLGVSVTGGPLASALPLIGMQIVGYQVRNATG